MTNIIQLVRFALHQIERLDSVVSTSKQYFNLWLGQNQREITDKQREVISRIVDYIASNGACTIKEIREDDATQASTNDSCFWQYAESKRSFTVSIHICGFKKSEHNNGNHTNNR